MVSSILQGGVPFILPGFLAAIIIFIISRKVSRKTLLLTATTLSLICIGIIIFSIEFIDSWVIFGIIFITGSVFLGIVVGTIAGMIKKK